MSTDHPRTSGSASAVPSFDRCRVVELRRYALRPGQRDTLIELFDREFVETQEAAGMCILGQFRDLDDPNSFVWMRGFSDMSTRKHALEAFYGGAVWRKHAQAANATMLDSDNVLLLRPIAGLEVASSCRAPLGSTAIPAGLLAVTIWPLEHRTAARIPELFAQALEPALTAVGITALASYRTEHSENTFPALPVREGQEVFVWTVMFENEADHARHLRALELSSAWRDASRAVAPFLAGAEEVLRLTPTARSALHG